MVTTTRRRQAESDNQPLCKKGRDETGVGATMEVAARRERRQRIKRDDDDGDDDDGEKACQKSIPNLLSAHPRAEKAP
jgi:hypothetical protein